MEAARQLLQLGYKPILVEKSDHLGGHVADWHRLFPDMSPASEAVSALEEREREIISLRFGLPDGREYTQKEVADLLGISQSYISRLEKRIIERLRRDMQRQLQV